jgi:hypothetical protein
MRSASSLTSTGCDSASRGSLSWLKLPSAPRANRVGPFLP